METRNLNLPYHYPLFIALDFNGIKVVFGLMDGNYYSLSKWEKFQYTTPVNMYIYKRQLLALVNKINKNEKLDLTLDFECARQRIFLKAEDLINISLNSKGLLKLYALNFKIIPLESYTDIKIDGISFTQKQQFFFNSIEQKMELITMYVSEKKTYYNLQAKLTQRNLADLMISGKIKLDDLKNFETLINLDELIEDPLIKPTCMPQEILIDATNIIQPFAKPSFSNEPMLNRQEVSSTVSTSVVNAEEVNVDIKNAAVATDNDSLTQVNFEEVLDLPGNYVNDISFISTEFPYSEYNQNEMGKDDLDMDFAQELQRFLAKRKIEDDKSTSNISIHNLFTESDEDDENKIQADQFESWSHLEESDNEENSIESPIKRPRRQ